MKNINFPKCLTPSLPLPKWQWYNKSMGYRKEPLATGHYYHIFTRSIAKYVVFNDQDDYGRFNELINLYRFKDFNYKYSSFLYLKTEMQEIVVNGLDKNEKLVEIVAYCIMPTHIHLLLKQTTDDGISKYVAKILNSYTRYFNSKYHRKGPLWEGHFKNVLVNSDEQLLHLTRYIHLNPTSIGLIEKPENWMFSSYPEYIKPDSAGGLCNFEDLFNLSPSQYRKFVNDQKSYQRNLSIIKSILIDNYSG